MAERTCAVTRQPAPREVLVRLVASPEGSVEVDYRGRAPGRGVWLACTAEALAGLDRAAQRIGASLEARCDAAHVRASLRDAVQRAAWDGLSQSSAAGALFLGHDVLVEAIGRGAVCIVCFAADASERTMESVRRAGAAPAVRLPWSAQALGAQVGRSVVAALGVPDAHPTVHLRTQLRRLSALG